MAEPMTDEKLVKMETARFLLEPPAPEVVGELLTEVRRLRGEIIGRDESWVTEREALRARLEQCESDLDAAQKEAARYFAGVQKWARRAEKAEKELAILNGGK